MAKIKKTPATFKDFTGKDNINVGDNPLKAKRGDKSPMRKIVLTNPRNMIVISSSDDLGESELANVFRAEVLLAKKHNL